MVEGGGEDKASVRAPAVFISYASQDAALANSIVENLEQQGLRCWLAPRDVRPGALYADAIVGAINEAKALVLVLSGSAVTSSHVSREVERAASKRKPMIAFRIDTAPLSRTLEYFLGESQWIDVRALGMPAALAKLATAVGQGLGQTVAADPGASARPGKRTAARTKLIAGAAALSVGVAAALGVRFWSQSHKAAQPHAEVMITDKSIAVLPFADMSEKKDQEYFSDGLSEELIDMLSKVPDLRVPARTSSFFFKGKAEDIATIAQKLRVAHILEGSVRKAGNTMRVTAQLIRAANGYHLWSETYDRELKDVFKVQDEIAGAVVTALKLKLAPGQRVPAGIDPEAHDDYLRGRYWDSEFTVEGASKGRDYFQRAIAKDPKYALAHAGVAESFIEELNCCGLPVQEAFTKAKESAIKALALDPSLAEAHTWLAIVKLQYDWDWSGAEDEFKQAIALNPNYAKARAWYSIDLTVMGRFEEAVKEAERAQDLDPFSIPINRWVVQVFYHSRRYDEALREGRRVREMHPDWAGGYHDLGDLYEQMKMFPEAFAAYQRELDLLKDNGASALGEAYERSGYKGYLLKKIQILEQTPHFNMYTGPMLAHEYAQLHDEPHAMIYLERAYAERYPWLLLLRVAPEWDPIRSSPRFRELVRRVGLPQPSGDKN